MPDLSPLHPLDMAVALRLAETPEAAYADLSATIGISASAAHAAVQRLQLAALLRPESRTVNWLTLREFLAHGVRYAFAVRPGAVARGVPTAYAAPPMARHILAADALVWPAVHGRIKGASITPLYARASELPSRCPSLYELLTLVDALRVGRVRERTFALEALDQRFGHHRPVA